jgi:SAM-dependent methyltransferase
MNSGNFNKIVELVIEKSPFQKKKLGHYLASRDVTFFEEAETFAVKYGGYLESQNIPINYAVSAYLEMCQNMMKCQIEFMKTGMYTVDKHIEAFNDVYSSENKMKPYMIGLAISQFLWPTHYEMYHFFAQAVKKYRFGIDSYLEIGPGHGLYLNKAMDYLPNGTNISTVDISPISTAITKSIMIHFKHDLSSIEFHTQDILKFDSQKKFDFITMGEVLEHVNFPEKLLQKLHFLLSDKGTVFVSTCVNAPAIDHVYHFRKVDEITAMLDQCGFSIINDRILPVENLPIETIIAENIAINYCAILGKK